MMRLDRRGQVEQGHAAALVDAGVGLAGLVSISANCSSVASTLTRFPALWVICGATLCSAVKDARRQRPDAVPSRRNHSPRAQLPAPVHRVSDCAGMGEGRPGVARSRLASGCVRRRWAWVRIVVGFWDPALK
jgi:hypothetical protein